MVFRLGTRVDTDPGALFVAFSPTCDIIECLSHSCGPGSHVAIQPMVVSVWPLPSIIGRLLTNKQIAIPCGCPFLPNGSYLNNDMR